MKNKKERKEIQAIEVDKNTRSEKYKTEVDENSKKHKSKVDRFLDFTKNYNFFIFIIPLVSCLVFYTFKKWFTIDVVYQFMIMFNLILPSLYFVIILCMKLLSNDQNNKDGVKNLLTFIKIIFLVGVIVSVWQLICFTTVEEALKFPQFIYVCIYVLIISIFISWYINTVLNNIKKYVKKYLTIVSEMDKEKKTTYIIAILGLIASIVSVVNTLLSKLIK